MERRLSDELPASARPRRSGRAISSANLAAERGGPIEQRALSAVRLGGDPMTVSAALDAAGRRRSPATMPGYHAGRAPRNKGQLYPADPPTVEEIIAVMRRDRRRSPRRPPAGADRPCSGAAGCAVQEALALGERDLDSRRGSLLVRRGEGWPSARDRHGRLGLGAAGALAQPPGSSCRSGRCSASSTARRCGRSWSSAGVRVEFRRLAAQAGVRRRFAPHQLRHAHAVELAREGAPLNVIQLTAGSCQPWYDQHLPAGHRHLRRSSRPSMRGERR